MEKKLPCWPSATPLLPEIGFWVACVSRLIGKFDTTGKRPGWQVHFGVTTVFDPCHVSPIEPRKHETPLPVEWRFAVLCRSLASQACEDGGYIRRTLRRLFPAGFPFAGPLLWRWLLPGPAVLWAGRDSLQQPVHHWHPLGSNSRTVPFLPCFQLLAHTRMLRLSIFWYLHGTKNPINNRFALSSGTADNNVYPCPPPQFAGSLSRTAGTVDQSAGKRNAPVERNPAPHLHPHSPTRTIRPSGSHVPAPQANQAATAPVRLSSTARLAAAVGFPPETGSHPHKCSPPLSAESGSAVPL